MNTPQIDSVADTSSVQKNPCTKLPYATPTLVVLGSATDMTHNTVGPGTDVTIGSDS